MNNIEFKIGDIVKDKEDGTIAVIIKSIYENEWFMVMDSGGNVWFRPNSYWKNTGKHIDIQSVLNKINEIKEELDNECF